jgi:hypothetical protein
MGCFRRNILIFGLPCPHLLADNSQATQDEVVLAHRHLRYTHTLSKGWRADVHYGTSLWHPRYGLTSLIALGNAATLYTKKLSTHWKPLGFQGEQWQRLYNPQTMWIHMRFGFVGQHHVAKRLRTAAVSGILLFTGKSHTTRPFPRRHRPCVAHGIPAERHRIRAQPGGEAPRRPRETAGQCRRVSGGFSSILLLHNHDDIWCTTANRMCVDLLSISSFCIA